MKMIYNGTPVKSLNVHHFEQDTNSATVQPSDMQAGTTCFARGKKVTGTGKAFEFAMYGTWVTNLPIVIPTMVNVVQISSIVYPIRMRTPVHDTTNLDFSTPQTIAEANIENEIFPITVFIQDGMLFISCDLQIDIDFFIGKDRYI